MTVLCATAGIGSDPAAVDLIEGAAELVVIVRGRAGGVTAWLGSRERRLVGAAIGLVLAARPLGGMTVTVEVGPASAPSPRRAAAVMLSADRHGAVLALLDAAGRPLAAAPLDHLLIERLSEVPA